MDVTSLSGDARFTDDLGADSLDMVEIAMALECQTAFKNVQVTASNIDQG
ncbi:hypothetical protein JKG47_07135 [Acidithiobacillus sp. MC6.1]|nr:hypothetical protein [Acidithiobacillus sp. MC6.1]